MDELEVNRKFVLRLFIKFKNIVFIVEKYLCLKMVLLYILFKNLILVMLFGELVLNIIDVGVFSVI